MRLEQFPSRYCPRKGFLFFQDLITLCLRDERTGGRVSLSPVTTPPSSIDNEHPFAEVRRVAPRRGLQRAISEQTKFVPVSGSKECDRYR